MSFNVIRENEILAKVCEFTVHVPIALSSSEGSGEPVHMHRLARAISIRIYNMSIAKRKII